MTRSRVLAAAGLVAWLLAEVLAIGLGAAGHGWMAPFFSSIPLILLYPTVLVRAFGSAARPTTLDAGIVVVAIILDAMFLAGSAGEDFGYFQRAGGDTFARVAACWVGLWCGWQIVALTSLFRRPRTPA